MEPIKVNTNIWQNKIVDIKYKIKDPKSKVAKKLQEIKLHRVNSQLLIKTLCRLQRVIVYMMSILSYKGLQEIL